ncbi:uncharacterized protein LOC124909754 [Impatiens glandulifera]|uniref:uncharacterized protein LOC124909754 n=1 Tax=Impatiens glandulifera TaxID=253017 RepID=UPI001FB08F94|nr:uncharacterized protein LOC124909754 [Impatiens glandulifera]
MLEGILKEPALKGLFSSLLINMHPNNKQGIQTRVNIIKGHNSNKINKGGYSLLSQHSWPKLQLCQTQSVLNVAGFTKENKKTIVPDRVFAMNQEKADPNSTIITGNLLIGNTLANTLIDTGATHYFVSANFVQKSGLRPDETKTVYNISLPSGTSLNTNKYIRVCKAHIQKHKMLVNLVVVEMDGFDVILGMFRGTPPPNPSFKTQQPLPSGIPIVLATSYAILGVQLPRVEDIKVVRNFPSVFLEDINGLPPLREVEFGIMLKEGTLPISKAPYRLAPTELK